MADTFEVSTPPVRIAVVGVDTLDEDEQAWIDSQNGIAGSLCSAVPIVLSAAIPAGPALLGIVRLVAEVHANDSGGVLVTVSESGPILDPG